MTKNPYKAIKSYLKSLTTAKKITKNPLIPLLVLTLTACAPAKYTETNEVQVDCFELYVNQCTQFGSNLYAKRDATRNLGFIYDSLNNCNANNHHTTLSLDGRPYTVSQYWLTGTAYIALDGTNPGDVDPANTWLHVIRYDK